MLTRVADNEVRCRDVVYPRGMEFPRPRRCARAAVINGYCKQHDPVLSKARNDAKYAKHREKLDQQQAARDAAKRQAETEAEELKRLRVENADLRKRLRTAKPDVCSHVFNYLSNIDGSLNCSDCGVELPKNWQYGDAEKTL